MEGREQVDGKEGTTRLTDSEMTAALISLVRASMSTLEVLVLLAAMARELMGAVTWLAGLERSETRRKKEKARARRDAMCRWVVYFGRHVLLKDVLLAPEHSMLGMARDGPYLPGIEATPNFDPELNSKRNVRACWGWL